MSIEANIGRKIAMATDSQGRVREGTIVGRRSDYPSYVVTTGGEEIFVPAKTVSEAAGQTRWHFVSPVGASKTAPVASAKPDYQKMAANAIAERNAICLGLDPRSTDFSASVARDLKDRRKFNSNRT